MNNKIIKAFIVSILLTGMYSYKTYAIEIPDALLQEPYKKIDTVQIQTSAVCGMCEERIEHNMAFEKGVKSVDLDNDTKILTVVYKTKKTNVEELKKAVTKIGYDADEMVADQKAHDRLPKCCQKGNEPH